MAAKNIYLISLFCIICCVKADDSPVPFITKCKASDEKCITKSTQDAIAPFVEGIAEFQVEKMDPMFIESLDVSSSQLKLYVKNFTIAGSKGCHVNKMDRNTKGKLVLDIICNLTFEGGKYEMDGHLLLVKIQGNGNFYIKAGGVHFNCEANLDEFIGKDGEKYWRITKWTYIFKVLGKCNLHFENLFSGNEVLGQAAKSLFDNNSCEIIEEIAGPVIEYIMKNKIVKNVNNFFKHVPAKYLSID